MTVFVERRELFEFHSNPHPLRKRSLREREIVDDDSSNNAQPSTAYARLSVNINEETAQRLSELMKLQGISATEAVRRAIALWAYITQQTYCPVCGPDEGCPHVTKHVEVVDRSNGTRQHLIQIT